MLASQTLRTETFPPQIRFFDVRHDLLGVANLIELCFADTLNQDGQQYIQQMRQAAQNSSFLGFPWVSNERTALPTLGFVWEENHQIIGNLTIITHHSREGAHYLIANVAVHPEHRRKGIAHLLTERALLYLHKKGAKAVWLHVRDDNPPAINLYQKLGFQENMRRTSWELTPNRKTPSSQQSEQDFTINIKPFSIRPRNAKDWHTHQIWLNRTYPPQFGWHLNFNLDCFQPGIKGWFYSSWYDLGLKHWSLYRAERLIGIASMEYSHPGAAVIYLALDDIFEDQAAYLLISFLIQKFPKQSSWVIDYPAYRAVQPLQALGFTPTQTLIWMSRPI